MKQIVNAALRKPSAEGIVPVWDEDSEILMLGSVTAVDGMRKGFYYASDKNQLWQLLDLCLNTDTFLKLKNKLKQNYLAFKNGEKGEADFNLDREKIRQEFVAALKAHKIAICDVFEECYFNNNSSLDTEIILNNPQFPYKLSKSKLEKIIHNSKIHTVIANSKFVATQFEKMGIAGDYKLEYVMSPSPRRGSIDKKLPQWREVFMGLNDENAAPEI